jgi:hypothetical protein
MSVKVRPYRRGGWEINIRNEYPNREKYRVRKRVTLTSKSAAKRWAEALERELNANEPPITKEEQAPQITPQHNDRP